MKTFLTYNEAMGVLDSYEIEEISSRVEMLRRGILQDNPNPEERAFVVYDFQKAYATANKALNEYVNFSGLDDDDVFYMQIIAYKTVYAGKIRSLLERYARMYNVKF